MLGAGLEALQLSRGAMRGSLVFTWNGPARMTSGHILGRVVLKGALARGSSTTVAVGLRMNGSHVWMRAIGDGTLGLHRGDDDSETVFGTGSFYAAITLDDDAWEQLAAEHDLVLDGKTFGGSRVLKSTMPPAKLEKVHQACWQFHADDDDAVPTMHGPVGGMPGCIVSLLAREPRTLPVVRFRAYPRIASRACRYIEENIASPMSIGAIARAAFTSQRSLYRAFHALYGETPQSYVRKLRLNRIRRDLVSPQEARWTVTQLAQRWGVSELGRLSAEYRDLYGELPSQTPVAPTDGFFKLRHAH